MAKTPVLPNLIIENARILFRNFSGNEGQFNREGDRNFCLPLEPDVAQQMIEDGWNVKFLKPREEDDEPQAYIQVAVNYKYANKAPKIYMITSRGRTQVDEDMVNILDWADFANIDLIVNPSRWEVNGKTGIKAYLKTLYVTIMEDELDQKYADVPDSAQNTIGGPMLEITDGIIEGEIED